MRGQALPPERPASWHRGVRIVPNCSHCTPQQAHGVHMHAYCMASRVDECSSHAPARMRKLESRARLAAAVVRVRLTVDDGLNAEHQEELVNRWRQDARLHLYHAWRSDRVHSV